MTRYCVLIVFYGDLSYSLWAENFTLGLAGILLSFFLPSMSYELRHLIEFYECISLLFFLQFSFGCHFFDDYIQLFRSYFHPV